MKLNFYKMNSIYEVIKEFLGSRSGLLSFKN